MNVLLRTVGLLVAGLVIAACGGGNGDDGDRAAIENLVREFIGAFEDGDADKLADLSSAECTNIEEDIAAAVGQLEALGIEVEFNVTGVDIRNLEGDSAEASPKGTISFGDEEAPLGEDEDYSRVVKEDGKWKIADCDYFLE